VKYIKYGISSQKTWQLAYKTTQSIIIIINSLSSQWRPRFKKVGRWQLQFSGEQLQISDGGDYVCKNFNFLINSPKMEDFPPQILYF